MREKKKIEVKLVTWMGNDQLIVDDARKSFDAETSEWRGDKDIGLIRYMKWWNHGVPFEAPVFKFALKIPIFVARQLVKYRLSSWNELSRRYVGDSLEFFDYELREKDTSTTKQGSGEVIPRRGGEKSIYYDNINSTLEMLSSEYDWLIRKEIAPETARNIQPMNSMTHVRWQMNLRELFHIFEQRLDPHAQKETRETVRKMRDLVKSKIPVSYDAWFDQWRIMRKVQKLIYPYYKRGEIDDVVDMLKLVFDDVDDDYTKLLTKLQLIYQQSKKLIELNDKLDHSRATQDIARASYHLEQALEILKQN